MIDGRLALLFDLVEPRLADLLTLDDAAFRTFFAGSPVKRIGRDRFLRNVLIAIGNSGDAGLLSAVMSALDDPSPIVRGAAVWALGRLDPGEAMRQGAARTAAELDPTVRIEWNAGQPAS